MVLWLLAMAFTLTKGGLAGFLGSESFTPDMLTTTNFSALWTCRFLHFRPWSGPFCRSFIRRHVWYLYLPLFERLRRNLALLQVFQSSFPKRPGSDCLSGDPDKICIFFPHIEDIFSIRHFFRVFPVGFSYHSAGYRIDHTFVFLSV
jgi:hypothetical protein